MIRRLFWLVLGAVLGVTGYRRASRRLSALLRPGRGAHGALAAARASRSGVSDFLRDAREGMDDYLDRHAAGRAAVEAAQARPGPGPDEPGRSRRYPGIDYVKDGH
ncbi:MAG: hypothetical protein ACLPUO_16115 [Streptosporangiaceae bacterium]|jgi:hypothetical protein